MNDMPPCPHCGAGGFVLPLSFVVNDIIGGDLHKEGSVEVKVVDGHLLCGGEDISSIMSKVSQKVNIHSDIHTSELVWVHQAWDDGFSHVACSITDCVLLVRAPRMIAVMDELSLPGVSVEYANKDAWLVVHLGDDLDVFDEVTNVLKSKGVQCSPEVDNLVDGKVKRAIMSEWYQEALDNGYGAPTMFPTQRVLKPHQAQASIIMSSSTASGILLADQVGLGKGGEFISAFLGRVEYRVAQGERFNDCFPCVVVTKSSLKGEIVEEIKKWNSSAKVTVLSGKSATNIDPSAQFIVINDAILKDWKDYICETSPQALIVDEAHSMSNPQSQRSKACLQVANAVRKNNGQVILATATPFQDGPYELWGLLKVLGVENVYAKYARDRLMEDGEQMSVQISTGYGRKRVNLTGKMAFEARWCNGHVDKWGHWVNSGASHSAELHKLLISNSMIRRKKSDVIAPLPDLNQELLKVTLSAEDRVEYDRQANEFAEYLLGKTAAQARRDGVDEDYATHVASKKLEESEAVMRVSELRQTLGLAKSKVAVNWIKRFFDTDEITGGDPNRNKLIVFCHHKEVQSFLVNHPDLKKYGVVNITEANTSPKGIQEAKRSFQKDPNTRLIICSSGATAGHTLTAAWDTLQVELFWGPTLTYQAIGRNWARFSEEHEPHEAYYHTMVAMETIDMATYHSNIIKKSLMDGYIDGEEIDPELIEERDYSLSKRQEFASALLSTMEGEVVFG